MEYDKLNKAAEDFADSIPGIGGGGDYTYWHVCDGFEKGAEWLMGQSLSERLTEDEKEMIKSKYMDLIPLKGHMAGIVGQMMLLESIFGKEMLNKE